MSIRRRIGEAGMIVFSLVLKISLSLTKDTETSYSSKDSEPTKYWVLVGVVIPEE